MKTRIKALWEKAAEHRGGENFREGVDLSVTQRHYKNLAYAGKHSEAGALMTICSGACWSSARLLEEGIITAEDAVCPLCGQPEADEGHLYWECPKVMEAPHLAIQPSNRFCAEYSREKADIKSRTLYWRGLVSEEETTPMGHIFDTADILKPISGCQDTKVTIFNDGSGGKRT